MKQLTILAAVLLLCSESRAEKINAAKAAPAATGAKWKIIGWNDLGMHCMDGKDFSIYSILPPYNTFHAHLIDSSGKLVKSSKSVSVTYQAIADPTGSINKTTASKTNFWNWVLPQFGANLAPDAGLAGFKMPGTANTPQLMRFDAPQNWFTAEGVPISPYDDKGVKNYYPMMRLTAKTGNTTLATADIVLPVSDEMDCKICHSSGSPTKARPAAGWSYLSDPEKDYKTNVLMLHDERLPPASIASILQSAGYQSGGLLATVKSGKPILCAKCHGTNALPGTGVTGVSKFTSAMHKYHAQVVDPLFNLVLDSDKNREACYRCHPGSTTKCLRGVMGNATAPDGSMVMQCQSCHGSMSVVGASTRNGWLEEPNCQACHTGTAVKNNGQIRYTNVFEGSGLMRVAQDPTFATNPNTPATGVSLYRFSQGHGGLQCESCHGSTHAEYTSSHVNDNVQIIALQGHSGVVSECTACHSSVPSTVNGGPHGLHPIGASWVGQHGDAAGNGASQCRTCHGLDYRGTVLSKTKADRSFQIEGRSINLKAGTSVGCYNCHNGPRGS